MKLRNFPEDYSPDKPLALLGTALFFALVLECENRIIPKVVAHGD